MPGINVYINFSNNIDDDYSAIKSSLHKMKYKEYYYDNVLYKSNHQIYIYSGFDEYPFQKIESSEYLILIDGAIYNKTSNEIQESLNKIIPEYLSEHDNKSDMLADFIMETDGEYIIYVIEKMTDRVVIINDGLGRLPLYFSVADNLFIAGRALKFVVENVPEVYHDKASLLDYMLLFIPLGNRTFFTNISRLMPSSVIFIDIKNRIYENKRLYQFNFDNKFDDLNLNTHSNRLESLFLEATQSRLNFFENRKSLLALSGGLDSRTVLLAFLKCKANFEAVTFRDFYNISRRDLPVVEELVQTYNLKHNYYDIPENDISSMEELILLKDGMSLNGIMGFVLKSHEMITDLYGRNIVWYTGEGGGYIMGPTYKGKKLESIEALADYIISQRAFFTTEEIAQLTGFSVRKIKENFINHLETYPEKKYEHIFHHFMVFEHLLKFSMEGEDRVRHYHWSTTPIYGINFVNYILKIDDKLFANWKVFKALFMALDKQSINIKYANWGLPLSSPFLKPYIYLRELATKNQKIKEKIIKTIRLLRHPGSHKKNVKEVSDVKRILDYLEPIINESDVTSIFDKNTLMKILQKYF